ncbi:uncharacterized protein LOC143416137 isoform X2 [Maylandia zebra]
MTLRKVSLCIVILLVIWNCLKYERHREFLNGFFEELMSAEESSIHLRQKRETSSNSTEYEFQAVISVSNLEQFQSILNTLSFPLLISATGEITSINTTTVCSPNITANITGYQCTCEESFAWSYNKCIDYEACDAIVGDTCGCINGLPADGQYCQLKTSNPVPVEYDIDFNLLLPVSSLPPNFIDLFRNYVGNLSFPKTITQSLIIEDLNFTTWCYPNSTGGMQCQCEDHFGWSCEKCGLYGACSNVTSQACGCIKGLPPDGEFCEPNASVAPCPTPPPAPVDFDIDLELHIPASSVPQNFSVVLRNILRNFSFPKIITGSLTLKDLNFTTWCYPNSTGGLQCQCEDQFAWSCGKCDEYGACSNVTSQTCDCIKGFPPDGEFCEPVTNIIPCPPMPNTTTPDPTTTTPMPNTTTPDPTTTTPMLNTTTPDPTTTTPMPNTTTPDPTTTTPMPNTTTPDPTTTTPMLNTTTPDPTITTPMLNTTTPDPTTTTPMLNTTTLIPNTTTPDPTTTKPLPTTAPTPILTNTTILMPNTTTPMTDTTTRVSSTTRVPTTTTTAMSTTTTTANTTTTITPTTASVTTDQLTINVEFSDTYNNPNSVFFRNVSTAIQAEAQKNKITAQLIKFRCYSL